MTLDDYRRFYAEEIEQVASLTSPALVEAFARVPREQFLGPPPWHISSGEARVMAVAGLGQPNYRATGDPRNLYHNVVVSIDRERDINNGQPSGLAGWIQALDLKPGDRVYHMGCGVGYYTAILAEMVERGGSVVAIDARPDLVARARENLSGYHTSSSHTGDAAAIRSRRLRCHADQRRRYASATYLARSPAGRRAAGHAVDGRGQCHDR